MMSESNISNNKRIAKNTLVLYLRMIFILCVGLFTSRVVLNALGVEDYGLYNVVGGFVTIFAFLNGAMSTATQRFITFELAKGVLDRQKVTFSTAIIIHFALATIVFILSETIGLWMLYEKLVIPEARFMAAFWVYQLSIISCLLSIISLPYNAMIIAHEKMSAFAYISIMDVTLKLVIVYLLTVTPFDRLILYAILLLCIQLLDISIYILYCKRKFAEAKFVFAFDKAIFKEMSNIAGWSLFGNLAGVGYTQGLNLLLNMFFGPAVNAARGVAVTVQGVVSGFVANFQMALNPQITKTYAIGNLHRMHNLIQASSKYSFYMLLIIVLPIMIEAQPILTLWLKIVPEHTVWFLRLTLCVMLIDTLANPLMVSSQATGKVKVYQSVVGGTLLLIIPIAYVCLRLGCKPESVFIVHLCMAIVAHIFRILIIGRQINLKFSEYVKKVLSPVLSVAFVSSVLSGCLYKTLDSTLTNIVVIIAVTLAITLLSSFFIGLSDTERTMIVSKATSIIKTKIHKQ